MMAQAICRPIRNQVLVKPLPSDEKSSGGIFVPESYREISNKVKIVAVGNGTKKTPMKFKKDQIVYKVKSNGAATWCIEVLVKGEPHYLIGQDAILAVE